MPNLVGIGNSQVPTNAMLGGLAYQDSVGEINLDKIKARTSDTAKDIFVYNTRKDSDGGAWRHRTQNTSWYNESASATRGARKEFPAVAIIVVESSQVTIYDGDDPNCPMWMVFNQSTTELGAMVGYTGATIRCCTMLNGILMVGLDHTAQPNVSGLRLINFISERFDWKANITGRNSNQVWPIIDRNGGRPFGVNDGNLIVNEFINGVAATILPNTPVDESTGLPNPTIAVATNGGTNVINADRTVTQGYQTIATENVDLHPDGFMTDGISGATNDSFSFYKIGTIARLVSYGHRVSVNSINTFLNEATGECLFEGSGNEIATAQTLGLLRIEEELEVETANDAISFGLHNRTTSSYNTGWMVGDVKGAFLADTDSTNVTGELIDLTNGAPVTGQAGQWGSPSANQIAALSTSDVVGRYDTGTDASVLVNGKQYLATLTISNYSGSGDLGVAAGAGFDGTFRYSADGIYYKYITYTSGEVQLFYRNTNQATIGISLREVEEDRSANNKGLAIHGTITKEPVATGAELVSYNSLTNSNYLKQPYNSDLNFGTGDFCMMGWFYNLGTSSSILYRLHNSTSTGIGYIVALSSGGEIGYSSYTQGFSSSGRITHYSSDTWNGIQNWNMFVCGKKSGFGYMYVNGVLKQTGANANSHTDTTNKPPLRIGNNHAGSGGLGGGKLALIRISSGFPSEKQIKKIYDDEKCLFHENAKCTFHGTSDAVTALAHDDSNNILHVGTSAGRSEFQGLNRINNTTTAVTTAISASNGLVVEQ